MSPRLLLASGSPQRRSILEQLGVVFEVVVPDVEEAGEGEPAALVVENALRKARAVAGGGPGGEVVLGADTIVSLGGLPFGKPRDAEQAEAYLRELSGRTHEVHSGLAVIDAAGERTGRECTRVRFRTLGEADLGWYLASGEWRDRAGGYAIQARGAALVEWVEGDPWNVVGLPVSLLVGLLPWITEG